MASHLYSNNLFLTMATPIDAHNVTKDVCEQDKTQPSADGLNIKLQEFGLCAYQFDQNEDGCTFQVMVIDSTAVDQLSPGVIRDELEKLLNGWLCDQAQGRMGRLNLRIRKEDIARMRPFFQLEPLKVEVSYAYCPGLQQWYWSPDRQLWHREDLLVVQAGDLQGQRLDKADLERLAKLKMIKENPKPGVQCPICLLKHVRPGNVFEGQGIKDDHPALSTNKMDDAVHDVRLSHRCSLSETPKTAARVPPGAIMSQYRGNCTAAPRKETLVERHKRSLYFIA